MVVVTQSFALSLTALSLPPGFSIDLYADNVPDARQIAIAPNGTVFVGSRSAGKVYALVDDNNDGRADRVHVIAANLNMPSGVAFRGEDLYVAEVHRILKFEGIEARLERPGKPVVIYDQLPANPHHGWKFIDFGPDGKLYVPVGAPCNVCEPSTPYGRILRMNPDGSEVEVFAEGVRNSVGFSWHPVTQEFWFTDNGRDWLGDDQPSCELNRAPKLGLHFGFPYVHGVDTLDPKFGSGHRAEDYTPPALELGAHVAPLGIEFYRGEAFGPTYKHALFIAEHGSWNRTKKTGYRLTVVNFDSEGAITRHESFVSGWHRGQAHWGRPVDVAMMDDGALLVSDDYAGVIYRIIFNPKEE